MEWEKEIMKVKEKLNEVSEEVKKTEELEEQILQYYRKLLQIIASTPYKPKRNEIELFRIGGRAYGPGNVYSDTWYLVLTEGTVAVEEHHIYYMTASRTVSIIHRGKDAIDFCLKIFEERAKEYGFEDELKRVITELKENLDKASQYFKARNKKLTEVVNKLATVLS